eukprot:2396865-Pyramimonas_sp.AAC.1
MVAAVPRAAVLDVLQEAEGSFRAEGARLAFQVLQNLAPQQRVNDLAVAGANEIEHVPLETTALRPGRASSLAMPH